ncbi:hypothetical protein GSI_12780 [Ganoderma sinense ZZ0214-1]|uniref:Uncharacterized protein n=1 Tax=Ganoderma sinense ZZ0214-1 TaxID=1077348 RepID=A0A2G8RTS0_9APHY|nr:hypothetical protein GSI_12780 [Ganoderma sinense ZZ0214-1]
MRRATASDSSSSVRMPTSDGCVSTTSAAADAATPAPSPVWRCTPIAACASATASFVPSPQKSTVSPFAESSLMYACLSTGRQLARTRSAGIPRTVAGDETAAGWSPLRMETRMLRVARAWMTDSASGRRVSESPKTATRRMPWMTQNVVRPWANSG